MKAGVVFLVLFLGGAKGLWAANPELVSSSAQMLRSASVAPHPVPAPLFYRLSLIDGALYASVLAYRTMDFFSTQPCLHSPYCREVELPQAVVDTNARFAAFEAGMAASEIGTSLWLHHHGHTTLARAMNAFSISTGTWGVVHNYAIPKYH